MSLPLRVLKVSTRERQNPSNIIVGIFMTNIIN
jgi:hypothetical protein